MVVAAPAAGAAVAVGESEAVVAPMGSGLAGSGLVASVLAAAVACSADGAGGMGTT